MTEAPAPRTHAEANRLRKDIVLGEATDEARLIRFVAGPDGVVVPDLARKLPGRGVWVGADRDSITTAAKKGLFSRAAKTKLTAPPDLADQVEALLARRVLEGLGLARKAGGIISGFEKVVAALGTGKVAWLVEAADGAEDGRRKILSAARKAANQPRLLGAFNSDELGLALGGENVIHTALLAGRGTDRWTLDVERLSGFRPLLPPAWSANAREDD
ncbi:RNA-binding protein [Caulobacter vibrioides]|uniref:RNA-binding protein n=1 Tax=Caulobacter vibrioides TaxID=155892 RepID=A0A290MNA1_CAUVI|nr:RNA-binding protein [Caulobacter vibrioides]ATC33566.1 RNA-binding protein [Caulobacter vibrioides]